MARLEPIPYWIAGIQVMPNLCTEVGDIIPWHVHDHPHPTMASRGKWIMRRKGEQDAILSSAALGLGHFPELAEILGGVEHEFEVLEIENGVAALLCLWAGGIK